MTDSLTQPATGGLGPLPTPSVKNLSLIQHNCWGSWNVFLSLFDSFKSASTPPTVVLLQDPSFPRNVLSHFADFKVFAHPLANSTAPKVARYVNLYLPCSPCVLSVPSCDGP